MDSLLVLTGVSGPADLLAAPPQRRPTYVAADLAGLFDPADAARVPVHGDDAGGWPSDRDGSSRAGRLRRAGRRAASAVRGRGSARRPVGRSEPALPRVRQPIGRRTRSTALESFGLAAGWPTGPGERGGG